MLLRLYRSPSIKKFWVVSAYMEKATGGTQAPNANGPGNTPDASLASNPIAFNNSIPTSQNTVKGKTVGPLGLDVAMSEQLRQLQEVYAKQQQQGELERLFLKGFEEEFEERDFSGYDVHSDADVLVPLGDLIGIRYDNGKEWEMEENANGMLRKMGNAGAFESLPERMSEKNVRAVAKEYGIDLKNITIAYEKTIDQKIFYVEEVLEDGVLSTKQMLKVGTKRKPSFIKNSKE